MKRLRFTCRGSGRSYDWRIFPRTCRIQRI